MMSREDFQILMENRIAEEVQRRLKRRNQILDSCDTDFYKNGLGEIRFTSRAKAFGFDGTYVINGTLNDIGSISQIDLAEQ